MLQAPPCDRCTCDASAHFLRSTVGVVLGCWLGAFFIPLDWDRPWQVTASIVQSLAAAYSPQVWPRTVAAGAVAGAPFPHPALRCVLTRETGHSAAMLLLLFVLLLRPSSRLPSARKGSE